MELLWAFGYATATVFAHALLVRLPLNGSRVAKFFLAGALLGLVLALHLLVCAASSSSGMAALAVYAFVCEFYLFLFTMAGTSISVRLLLAMRKRSLAMAEIAQLNDSAGLVEGRVRRLMDTGLLQEIDGGHGVSAQGRRLVRGYWMLRRVFRQTAREQLGTQFSASADSLLKVPNY